MRGQAPEAVTNTTEGRAVGSAGESSLSISLINTLESEVSPLVGVLENRKHASQDRRLSLRGNSSPCQPRGIHGSPSQVSDFRTFPFVLVFYPIPPYPEGWRPRGEGETLQGQTLPAFPAESLEPL